MALDWPLSSFDARDWAEAFCKINPGIDEGVMLSWFANALMRGFDERAARAALSPTDHELHKNACFISRSRVREILMGTSDEYVHITEVLLSEIDKLPITTIGAPETAESFTDHEPREREE